jgi:hypothetical protein
MVKITKKEFENLLTSKESYFIASHFSKLSIDKILELIKQKENAFIENKNQFKLRKGLLKSNAIVFENVNEKVENSYLYFNQQGIKRFYKYNDFVIYHNENVNFIVYLLKH